MPNGYPAKQKHVRLLRPVVPLLERANGPYSHCVNDCFDTSTIGAVESMLRAHLHSPHS